MPAVRIVVARSQDVIDTHSLCPKLCPFRNSAHVFKRLDRIVLGLIMGMMYRSSILRAADDMSVGVAAASIEVSRKTMATLPIAEWPLSLLAGCRLESKCPGFLPTRA